MTPKVQQITKSILVSEIFYSIQGEGVHLGTPEVFLRLAGCNLRCISCDTKYAFEGRPISLDKIIKKIKEFPCQRVSITGGEPLLQRKSLLELIKRLKREDYWLHLNTNGTIFDKEIFKRVDWISIDGKCPSTGEKSNLSVLKKTKKYFGAKTEFKFVIKTHNDYQYLKSIIQHLADGLRPKAFCVLQPDYSSSKKFIKKLIGWVKRDGLPGRVIIPQQKIIRFR